MESEKAAFSRPKVEEDYDFNHDEIVENLLVLGAGLEDRKQVSRSQLNQS